MFGSNNDDNLQNNFGAQTAGPANDFGTMPPIENTPFGSSAPVNDTPADAPAEVPADTPVTDAPVSDAPSTDTPAAAPGTSDLLNIKQDALTELTPLVGHLEQTPEEKFRTTMMMIQAADDQSLVSVAFEAAKQISDDKARAQALLDVINEINYFTQHQNQS